MLVKNTMTTEDESPIIKTTGRRMAKGLAIIVIMVAFGAAVAVPNWHNFAKNPPPVSTITTQSVSSGGGGAAGSASSSGGGASTTDPNSGKVFDTKMINAGSNSDPVEITSAKVGDVVAYYCQIHPYMTGKLSITAASASQSKVAGSMASGGGGPAAASGPSLTILQGASVQGKPDYQPDTLSV